MVIEIGTTSFILLEGLIADRAISGDYSIFGSKGFLRRTFRSACHAISSSPSDMPPRRQDSDGAPPPRPISM